MWVSISETLNSFGEGATKDWKGWSNYWVDYKAKLKRRVAALRTSQNRTGGGPAEVQPLNDIEKKFLSLLGEGFGSGLPNTQVDPFPILTPPTMHIGPEAGQAQPQQEPSSNDGLQEVVVIIEEDSLPQLEEAITLQEEEPSTQQTPAQPQRPANVQGRRRSRRPSAMSQQLAREALVEISRDRLLAEQENSRSLRQIAEGLQGNQLLLQEMLGTLNRIAAVIDRSMGPGRPETRDEGVPDS
ncbi:hypothetical protein PYW08_007771 [Mythimna loreyi]|uniref:Uncharacterized protein n=1 Tax=Mythimna loreyi TaxID=667449 RepID=A0ACC2QFB7_9NEOP|nr:hypothetical protein PYW08_007771 [Mythimna loreyi]